MTELIRSARPRRSDGLLDRLRGTAPNTDDRQERFHRAVAEIERAAKTGDELGREMAEARLDAVLDEVRADRQASSNSGHEPAEPAPSFDGGVRRPAPRPRQPLTVLDAARAELASRDEIRQRHQDHAWDRAARR